MEQLFNDNMIELMTLHTFFLLTLGFCCYKLIRALRQRTPHHVHLSASSTYSATALKIGRGYRVFSYAVLTMSFFVALVLSSYQIVVEF